MLETFPPLRISGAHTCFRIAAALRHAEPWAGFRLDTSDLRRANLIEFLNAPELCGVPRHFGLGANALVDDRLIP